jgi:hypothetical protein
MRQVLSFFHVHLNLAKNLSMPSASRFLFKKEVSVGQEPVAVTI